MDVHAVPVRRLTFWMQRVLRLAQKARSVLSSETVHKIRTSVRRCFSLLRVLKIDCSEKIDRIARPLFKESALLRDLRVMRNEIVRLPMDRKTRRKILSRLSKKEKPARAMAAKAVGDFNDSQWQILMHAVHACKISPAEPVFAKRQAFKRLARVRKLQKACARRQASSKDLHRLRIAIKKFRYTVENVFPHLYAKRGRILRKIQDTLGRHQDLVFLEKELDDMNCLTLPLLKTLESKRGSLRKVFLKMTQEPKGIWKRWQKELVRI